MKYVIYLRVSTNKQTEKYGIDLQREGCLSLIEQQKIKGDIIEIEEVIDGSDAIDEREGLLNAVSSLEKGDVLVAFRRDRLGRDAFNMYLIEKMVKETGGRLITPEGMYCDDADQAEATLFNGMLDLFSQYEKARIKLRLKLGIKQRMKNGLHMGKVPYGMKYGANSSILEPNLDEQVTLGVMFDLRQKGFSYERVARALNDLSMPKRDGGIWGKQDVCKIMRNNKFRLDNIPSPLKAKVV